MQNTVESLNVINIVTKEISLTCNCLFYNYQVDNEFGGVSIVGLEERVLS